MHSTLFFTISIYFFICPFLSWSQTLKDLPIHKSELVIYDNDDHRDVYTDEYLLSLNHSETVNLIGIITTYAPSKSEYELFIEGRKQLIRTSEQSGLKNLPKLFPGTNSRLEQPPSNRIEDTQTLDLEASEFIVKQAHRASNEAPLVIISGGQLTTIANAYLMDTTIADKIIISGLFGVKAIDYNAGLDAWAWKIVLSKFRVLAIPIGPSQNRGVVYMKPPQVSKSRIKSTLPQSTPFFYWMYKKHHPSNRLPNGGDYDGQAAIPLMRPDYITSVRRWTVKGLDEAGNLIVEEDSKGKVFEALNANQKIATEEFWRAMLSLNNSLNP